MENRNLKEVAMFESLDAVIATAAVIVALSLAVQAIQQIIKQCFDLKSKYMKRQLLALFGTTRKDGLSAGIRERWSSGPAKLIAAPVSWVAQHIPEEMYLTPMQELSVDDEGREIVQKLTGKLKEFGYKDLGLLEDVDAKTFKKIVASISVGGKKLSRDAQREIDTWFELSKKAFQELYERRMKYWSLGLSLAVVLVFNVNLFEVYREFVTDKALRASGVALARALDQRSGAQLPDASSGTQDEEAFTHDTTVGGSSSKHQLDSLFSSNAFSPWRWTPDRWKSIKERNDPWGIGLTLFGWLAAALMVSLGAPFWYDVLKSLLSFKQVLKSKEVRDGAG